MIGVGFALITGCFSHCSSNRKHVGVLSGEERAIKILPSFRTHRKGGRKEEKQQEKRQMPAGQPSHLEWHKLNKERGKTVLSG